MNSIFYINVFRDDAGKIHYSNDEFFLGQIGLFSFADAAKDLYHFCVLQNWDYVCTLSNNAVQTVRMQERLESFRTAKNILEAHGKDPGFYEVDEIENMAEYLKE